MLTALALGVWLAWATVPPALPRKTVTHSTRCVFPDRPKERP